MKTNERVILIKGDATKWYDQAIFIVNKDMPPEKIPVDFVAEAEKIINHYIINKNRQYSYTSAKPAARLPAAVKPAARLPAAVKPAARRKAANNKRFDLLLNMVMLAGCLVIAGMFLFGMAN